MNKIVMYSTPQCPYCARAKAVLSDKVEDFQEIDISAHPEARTDMIQKSGRRTVPQIWINDYHVGGCDDLLALQADGKLDSLFNA